MSTSPRMQWPYPRDGEDPWYSSFEDMVRAEDASVFALHDEKNIILSGGGVISWDATLNTVTWALPIILNSSQSGYAETIAAGSLSTVVNDGALGYVLFQPSPQAPVTLVLASADVLPPSEVDNTVVLFRRRQNKLYWRNGQVLNDGDSLPIIDAPGGGGSTIPGGVNTNVQFNNAGAFGGSPLFTWDGAQVAAPRIALSNSPAPVATPGFGTTYVDSAQANRLYFKDSTGQAFNLTLDRFVTVAPAGAVALDHDPALPCYRSLSVLVNTTFTTTNLGNGRGISLRLVSTGGPYTLTWPAGWKWLGTMPTSIPANKTAFLATIAFGPLNTDVVAIWTEEGASGTVTAVTASAPLASSGGATPDISLTGIVPVANGGTGLAAPGVVGNVLTSTGAVWVSSPSAGSGTTLLTLDTSLLTLGDVARIAANGLAGAASGTAIGLARAVGIVHTIGGAGVGKVQPIASYATANFIAGLVLTAGDPVYISLTTGKLTNDVTGFAPGNVVAEIGIIDDASAYVSPLFLTASVALSIKGTTIL